MLYVARVLWSAKYIPRVYRPAITHRRKVFATGLAGADSAVLVQMLEPTFDCCTSCGYFTKRPQFDAYDCFVFDAQQIDFYALYQWYPDAYFVVTTGTVLNIAEMKLLDDDVVDSIRRSLLYVKKFEEYFGNAPGIITLRLEEVEQWPRQLGLLLHASIDGPTHFPNASSSNAKEIEQVICDTRWVSEIRTAYNCPILDSIPNVMTVGTQKAGTQSFSYMMRKSVQGYPDEVHYFDRHINVSVSGYLNQLPMANFSRSRGLIHEKTPDYLPYASRVAKVMPPSTKIIILVREPVQRFISAARHHVDIISPYRNETPWEDFKTYDKCIRKPPALFKGLYDACYDAFEKGLYIDQILEWTRYFENVWVETSDAVWRSDYDWSQFEEFLGQRLGSKMVHHHATKKSHYKGMNVTFSDTLLSTLRAFYAPYNNRLKKWFQHEASRRKWQANRTLPDWLLHPSAQGRK